MKLHNTTTFKLNFQFLLYIICNDLKKITIFINFQSLVDQKKKTFQSHQSVADSDLWFIRKNHNVYTQVLSYIIWNDIKKITIFINFQSHVDQKKNFSKSSICGRQWTVIHQETVSLWLSKQQHVLIYMRDIWCIVCPKNFWKKYIKKR